jgi:serine/threonine protein phosphatase PrpC
MVCPKCGAQINEDDNFCEDCGASLKKIRQAGCGSEDEKENPKSDVLVIDSSLAVACNVGRRHPRNEDSGTVMRCVDGTVIMVVSDGVTSAVNSISASQQAINKVKEVLAGGLRNDMDSVKNSINRANDIILGLPYETREDGIYGPEATIVIASVTGNIVTIGWVGDSRAYVLSELEQKLLTTDDSWIELVVAAGEMTRDEAMKDKRSHYVTQVMGMHDQEMEIHTLQCRLEENEMLLLCSDGLWNYFPGNDDLLKIITDFGMDKDAAEICDYLVNMANNAGGHDNITVAILKR